MKNFIRRLKNLWQLSAYRMENNYIAPNIVNGKKLVKDFPTIAKRSATIIELDKEDLFAQINDKTSKRSLID